MTAIVLGAAVIAWGQAPTGEPAGGDVAGQVGPVNGTPVETNVPISRPLVIGVPTPTHARGLVELAGPDQEAEVDGLTGFGPRIVREAAEVVGRKVKFVVFDEADAVPLLESGKLDGAIAVSMSQDRLKRVRFTAPLLVARGAVYGLESAGPARTAEELRKRSVAVASAGAAHQWCIENNIPLMVGPELKDAFDRVLAGEAAYVVTLMPAGRREMEQYKMAGLKEWVIEDPPLSRSFSVAFRRELGEAQADINTGLTILRDSGRFDEVYDEYAAKFQPRLAPKAVPMRMFWMVLGGSVIAIAGVGTAYGLAHRALRRTEEQVHNVRRESRLLHDEVRSLGYTYQRRGDGTREVLSVGDSVGWWKDQYPGFDPASPWEKAFKPRMHPDDIEPYRQAVLRARESASLLAVDFRLKDKNGQYRWLHSRVVPTPSEEGVVWCALLLDIHDTHQMRTTLARTEMLYSELFQSSPEAIVLFRADDERIVEANARALALYGVPRGVFIGSSMREFSTDVEASKRAVGQVVEEGKFEGTFRQKLPDGREIVVRSFAACLMLSGEPFILAINRDITEQLKQDAQHTRLELELRSAKQMEALGVMAGGIAHDFNNLLVGILGNASLAKRQTQSQDRLQATLARIEEAGQFAADLVKRLMEYAGKSNTPAGSVELEGLARGVVETLGERVTKHARVEVVGAPAWIHGDPVGVKQAVMNLVTNATDAQTNAHSNGHTDAQATAQIPASQGGVGEIRLRTGVRYFDPRNEADCCVGNDLAAGTYAFVCVEDSGPGIDPAVRERMFEPFVSTKAQGRGLGLALVLSTIRRTGGAVCVRSVPGLGTWFELLWPARPAAGAARAVESRSAPAMSGARVALVVDDNPAVRSTAAEITRMLGFTVHEVDTGEQALEILERVTPDVVILDVSLPGISGWQVLERIRATKPGLRVVMSTGHDPTRGNETMLPDGFLPKPYTVDQFVETLGQVLGLSLGEETPRR